METLDTQKKLKHDWKNDNKRQILKLDHFTVTHKIFV